MMKLLLATAAAAVAFSAAPAEARHHQGRHFEGRHHMGMMCNQWHGRCVSSHRMAERMRHHGMMRRAAYRNGYVFGPRYGYTSYDRLPHSYVSRYDLNRDYRYVYRDNYIYVVDPKTYAVERIISALAH